MKAMMILKLKKATIVPVLMKKMRHLMDQTQNTKYKTSKKQNLTINGHKNKRYSTYSAGIGTSNQLIPILKATVEALKADLGEKYREENCDRFMLWRFLKARAFDVSLARQMLDDYFVHKTTCSQNSDF